MLGFHRYSDIFLQISELFLYFQGKANGRENFINKWQKEKRVSRMFALALIKIKLTPGKS